MRIKATCETCGRDFLLSQIAADSDSAGRCPFCGTRFGRHYSTVLIEAVEEAEGASARFVHAINRLHGMQAGFRVDVASFLEDVGEHVPGDAAAPSSQPAR